jgi:hypothetical protein
MGAHNATSTSGESPFLSLAALALFGLTMIPDVLDKYGVIRIPAWLTMGSIDDARAILGATMGAVATVLALIFSVALLVLSMVATLFGPRLLYRFLQDWVTQVTIGLFMGTFIYICLVFLVTHKNDSSEFDWPRACPRRPERHWPSRSRPSAPLRARNGSRSIVATSRRRTSERSPGWPRPERQVLSRRSDGFLRAERGTAMQSP